MAHHVFPELLTKCDERETLIPAKYNPRPPGTWPRFQFLSFVQLQVQPTMSERCILMPSRPKEFPSLLFQKSQIKDYRWPDGYNGPRLWPIIVTHCSYVPCESKSKNKASLSTVTTSHCLILSEVPYAWISLLYNPFFIHNCLSQLCAWGRERKRTMSPNFHYKMSFYPNNILGLERKLVK